MQGRPMNDTGPARAAFARVGTTLRRLAAGAMMLLVPALAAAQPADVAAARKEGKVMMYGEIITPTSRAIKEGFEAKYPGITMEFIYQSGQPLMNRIVTEQDGGRYLADVFVIDTVRMPYLKEKGYLAPHESPEQKAYDKQWWSDPPNWWIRNHLYLGGIMYNTKLVAAADVPKTYEDLLDPKWKGKIALVSPITNDLMLALFAGWIRDMGEQKATAFFEKLAAQKPYVFGPGGIRVSQGVGTGEFPIGIGFIGHVYSVGKETGGNMAFAQTNPVYALGGPGFALAKRAPHPNAARLLVDYMLSAEVQNKIAVMGYRSTRPGVTASPELAAAKVSVPPVPAGADAEKLRTRLKQYFGG